MVVVEPVFISVGHGAAALLRNGDATLAIDVGTDADEFAVEMRSGHAALGEPRLDALILSHLHKDHAGAALDVIDQFRPSEIYVNPFGAAGHLKLYRAIVARAKIYPNVGVFPLAFPKSIVYPGIQVRTFWPSVANFRELGLPVPDPTWSDDVEAYVGWARRVIDAASDPEAAPETRQLNRLSAVVTVDLARKRTDAGEPRHRRVFFGGDIDLVSVKSIARLIVDQSTPFGERPSGDERDVLYSDVVLWPHHGGRPGGSDPLQFALTLTRLTRPSGVAFSTGEAHPGNPLPEIVMGLRHRAPKVQIRCTGLSHVCWPADRLPAYDEDTRYCCGSIDLVDGGQRVHLRPRRHNFDDVFLRRVPNALCT